MQHRPATPLSRARLALAPALRIARRTAWAPALVVLAHRVAGGAFGHEPVVDPIMHFCGGAAIAYVAWRGVARERRLVGDLTPLGTVLLCVGLATVAAVGWELAEFLVDRSAGSNMQRGLANTMRDLLLGMSGATTYVLAELAAAVAARSTVRRER